MIRVLLRYPDGRHVVGDEQLLAQWAPAAGVLAWVDIDRHDEQAARAAAQRHIQGALKARLTVQRQSPTR